MVSYKEGALWSITEPFSIEPNGERVFVMPSNYESAASSLLFIQKVKNNGASSYSYNIKASVSVSVEYKNKDIKTDTFCVVFNKDRQDEEGYFTNYSQLNLAGNDIEKITVNFKNNAENDTLDIESFSLYESEDVQITTIAKVLKEETIQASLIQATSILSDGLFAQQIQTNFWSMDARKANPGQIVNFIEIKDWTVSFYTVKLSEEKEQFFYSVNKAGYAEDHYYWYTSIEGPDAYKYVTDIDPWDKYPDMADSEREKFKFFIYKAEYKHCKQKFHFELDENGNPVPVMRFGAGTDDTGVNGTGRITKTDNGFYFMYTTSKGEEIGFILDEDGAYVKGLIQKFFESLEIFDNGFKLKFPMEVMHSFEYVFNDNNELTAIIQDKQYQGTITRTQGRI